MSYPLNIRDGGVRELLVQNKDFLTPFDWSEIVAQCRYDSVNELRVNDCKLDDVPDTIQYLTDLRVVSVARNELCAMPLVFAQMTFLEVIDIRDNPFYDRFLSLYPWVAQIDPPNEYTTLLVFEYLIVSLPTRRHSLSKERVLSVMNDLLKESVKRRMIYGHPPFEQQPPKTRLNDQH